MRFEALARLRRREGHLARRARLERGAGVPGIVFIARHHWWRQECHTADARAWRRSHQAILRDSARTRRPPPRIARGAAPATTSDAQPRGPMQPREPPTTRALQLVAEALCLGGSYKPHQPRRATVMQTATRCAAKTDRGDSSAIAAPISPRRGFATLATSARYSRSSTTRSTRTSARPASMLSRTPLTLSQVVRPVPLSEAPPRAACR
jgi:hypothetical protein